MQQRITELGVRKAFGGTKSVLVRQILNENLMLTLLGGVVGLLFSYLAVYAMRMWLFTNNQNVGTSGEFSLNMEALFLMLSKIILNSATVSKNRLLDSKLLL